MLVGRFVFDVKYIPIFDMYWNSLGYALLTVAFLLSLYLYARARLFADVDQVNPNGNTGIGLLFIITCLLFITPHYYILGNVIYDFFIGHESNPDVYGDLKFLFE